MPYDLSWHNDHYEIILIDTYGTVTWDQWHETINVSLDMLERAPRPVYVVIRDQAGMPPGNPIPHMKATATRVAEHGGFEAVIVVSLKSRATFSLKLMNVIFRFVQVTPWPIITAASFEEALRIIKERRPDIHA